MSVAILEDTPENIRLTKSFLRLEIIVLLFLSRQHLLHALPLEDHSIQPVGSEPSERAVKKLVREVTGPFVPLLQGCDRALRNK